MTGTNRTAAVLPLVAVTFHVNQWFRGGSLVSATSVTVDIAPPIPVDGRSTDDMAMAGQTYGVGTRLLVSGEPRWEGASLSDLIAWGCGFTRYQDPDTADSWRAAVRS